jgi:hypothetical protein
VLAGQPHQDATAGAAAVTWSMPMTERHDAHMSDPAVTAALAALDQHVAEHADCRNIAHQRDLCPDAQRLHDAVVSAAQDAYRAAHPEAFAPEPHDG